MGITYQQFIQAGGILPSQNVAARQASIAASHPRVKPAVAQQRASLQVFRSFRAAGQLGGLFPQSTPNTQGAIGQTQYTSPGFVNNGPTDAQSQADTGAGGGGGGYADLTSQGTGLATNASGNGGVFSIFSALSPTEQYLIIGGVILIGGFLLFREFKK